MEKILCWDCFFKVQNASEKKINGENLHSEWRFLHSEWRKLSVEFVFQKKAQNAFEKMNGEISILNGENSL